MHPHDYAHTHSILYVDDDRDDLQLLREAMEHIDGQFTLLEARDGLDGLERLHALKAGGKLPCLIVLDINMPRLDGRKTFQLIRQDPAFAGIPVVIFSTSNSELDKLFFRGKNVEYITKPIRFEQLIDVAGKLLEVCAAHVGISDR